MAKLDPKTAGSQFLADVLAKLPAEQQAQAKALFEDAGAAAALEVIGQGVLRQSDYSRQANELKTKETELETWHQSLTGWYEGKQAELAELPTLREKVKGLGTPDPTDPTHRQPAAPVVDPAKYVSKEDFDKTLADTERGAVGFFSQLNALSLKHYQQFGEILDTDQLLQDKRIVQLGLQGVYAEVHKEQLDQKAAEAAKKAEDAIRADERAKTLAAAAATQHPYPVRGNEPSTLDVLEAARSGSAPVHKSVDDMAAEYARLGAGR